MLLSNCRRYCERERERGPEQNVQSIPLLQACPCRIYVCFFDQSSADAAQRCQALLQKALAKCKKWRLASLKSLLRSFATDEEARTLARLEKGGDFQISTGMSFFFSPSGAWFWGTYFGPILDSNSTQNRLKFDSNWGVDSSWTQIGLKLDSNWGFGVIFGGVILG